MSLLLCVVPVQYVAAALLFGFMFAISDVSFSPFLPAVIPSIFLSDRYFSLQLMP